MHAQQLTVIIPVFNEESSIRIVVEKVLAQKEVCKVIVVNDASTDGTGLILQEYKESSQVTIITHPKNLGKGAAIRTALNKADTLYTIIQDADLEYDPNEFPKLMEPIYKYNADAVFGTRFGGNTTHRVLYFWHYLGNKILTIFSNALTNLNLSDMEVGAKIIRTDIFRKMKLQENRFGIEVEITAKLAKTQCIIYEVPISYNGRTYAEGKKITWKDGVVALWCILKYNKF